MLQTRSTELWYDIVAIVANVLNYRSWDYIFQE
jgi:hypothetical protein